MLLNIPKYYSIYRVIYMLMHRLPLHRPFDAGCMLPVRTVMRARTKRGIKRQKRQSEREMKRKDGGEEREERRYRGREEGRYSPGRVP